MNQTNGGDVRRVLVWRTSWLAQSETFIRDQVEAYSTWQARSYGLVRIANPLTDPDQYLVKDSRVTQRLLRHTPSFWWKSAVSRQIAGLSPSLIHAHFGPDGIIACQIARRLDIPIVVTFHGWDVTAVFDNVEYCGALRALFADASKLIAVSNSIAGHLHSLGADPKKVVVHHTGIPLVPRRNDLHASRRGVLFIGRLVEKKGVDDLIRAYGQLPASVRSEHPLTIIGSGPLQQSLVDLSRNAGVEARFAGMLSSAKVAAAISQAAIVCVPSRTAQNGDSEGLPTVLLEAAALGSPIVASQHAGNPEVVHHNRTGLLFPESDVDELCQHLQTLLADRTLAIELAAEARLWVEAEFDIRTQTKQLENVYDLTVGN